jgi:hypothetical protein
MAAAFGGHRFTGTTSSHIVNSRLMSYGSSFAYTIRQHGIYTARIFKGENPSDVPVEQPARNRVSRLISRPRRDAAGAARHC